METKTDFEMAVEKEVGESVEAIRQMPIDERRRRIENKFHQVMRIVSFFPFIGRGNVLRDQTVPHEVVESELRKAIR